MDLTAYAHLIPQIAPNNRYDRIVDRSDLCQTREFPTGELASFNDYMHTTDNDWTTHPTSQTTVTTKTHTRLLFSFLCHLYLDDETINNNHTAVVIEPNVE
jgi:hypothetical protein